MAYTKNIKLLNRYLLRESITLNEINIKFKFSLMELSDFKGKRYTKTSDFPDKVSLANELKDQGLTFYTLYANEEALPAETERVKQCVLGKANETCATCNMKCYLEDVDIVAVARL